jgi:hypothetical protein
MFPREGEPIELQIANAVAPDMFVDEADLGGVVVRTIHRINRLGGDRIRIVYAMEITGPEADTADRSLGPRSAPTFHRSWLCSPNEPNINDAADEGPGFLLCGYARVGRWHYAGMAPRPVRTSRCTCWGS